MKGFEYYVVRYLAPDEGEFLATEDPLLAYGQLETLARHVLDKEHALHPKTTSGGRLIGFSDKPRHIVLGSLPFSSVHMRHKLGMFTASAEKRPFELLDVPPKGIPEFVRGSLPWMRDTRAGETHRKTALRRKIYLLYNKNK